MSRALTAAVAAVAVLLAGGCGSEPSPVEPAAAAAAPNGAPADEPTGEEADADAVEGSDDTDPTGGHHQHHHHDHEGLRDDPFHDHDSHHPAGGHDHVDPPIALDDPRVTPQQRRAARDLIEATTRAMDRFDDVASVEDAGYRSIGDGGSGYEHFVNVAYLFDGRELDPEAVESVVFRVNPDGSRELVSAMYILEAGRTMADVPDVAGELTTWHDHQDLCWDGIRVVGRLVDGRCTRGEFRPTPPMLHVWLVDRPCGPFAGLEGHGEGCGHHHR